MNILKFNIIRQKDAMQCGVACLAMICRHFGADYSLDFLGRYCHATTEGVSMKGIKDAAERLGLDAEGGKLTVDELANIPLPCILHWNQNHFVVLYKVSKDARKFYIADPAKGLRTINRETLESHWATTQSNDAEKGIAMIFETTESFGNIKEDKDTEPRSFRFLLGYVKQYRRYFAQIIAGLFLGCVLQLIMPFLTQATVDIGIKHGDIGLIWLILLGELMIVAGRTATDFIRRWLLLHISMRINISLLSDFFIKLLKLPMSFFDTKLTGDLMQRMSDHGRVQSFLTGELLNVVFICLSFLTFGIVLLIYNWVIFLVFLAGTLAYGLWIGSFLHRRKMLDYELFECQAQNQNKTFQFITSMQEIKLQDCERRRRHEWEDVQADLFEVQMKSLRLQQSREAGSIFINEVKNIVITVVAATAVINGQMSLGEMLAVQYIIGQLNSPVAQVMSFVYSIQDVKISLERINEIHRSRNEEESDERSESFAGSKTIAVDDVSFRYDPHALKKTLDNVSFNIEEGKVTAIVGASGSGKTTLIKLMLGYYPVESGQIKIGDRPIEDYNMKWWRRHCGVVMQDGVIFSESIARNIAVDDNEIDLDRLEQAARIANIHEYVMSLPLKYNTLIGRDGVGLSQGQKQRILIARAVYKDPDFIFLDEATNSLDATNEREIVDNLSRFYRGRTVVIVAHRLSTVRNADRIVVLDKGRVVETGNHESLTAARGAYYNLVKNQLELGN
ncbi:MAG: peptidase domain-containing ABC transporter [Muribaculaceae bacterium]|nr:peptidase domain-containing ABC transporter [Muribaculaceae bacterium]